MLELKKVSKTYETKDLKVKALKNISVKFRENEFVSILGPSGCGKTTLLNIVGGLDKYTSGDLIINNKSTKEFTDRDWDAYRNHTIGFVFQSYNLIPHQTVLQNVELALTLSGVSAEERKKRAKDALKKVGLAEKLNSKPNQLSGGQMQRVAIARALVNNPDVVLADEPTGALDSKTSVQVMELLKEIAKEKLVIMVTHNPSLAEEYSTRIIKFLDGELVDDSDPIKDDETERQKDEVKAEELAKTTKKGKRKPVFKKTSMSFFTALSLSFKNLLTKKARTLLVAVAGSIGIFGIALILALSSGFQAYIDKTQEDTLSSYPITIQQTNANIMEVMMSMFTPSENPEHEADAVYGVDTMSGLFQEAASQMQKTNDLESFKKYIEEHQSELGDAISAVQYTYQLNLAGSNDMSSMMGGGSQPSLVEVKLSDGSEISPKSNALYNLIIMYSSIYLEGEFPMNVVNENDAFFLKLNDKTDKKNTKEQTIGFLTQHMRDSGIQNWEQLIEDLNAGNTIELSNTDFATIITKSMGVNIASFKNMNMGLFTEMIDNLELLQSQYELLGTNSAWATNANEVMLVLNQDSELDDYILYALGLYGDAEMQEHLRQVVAGEQSIMKIDFNKVLNRQMKVLLNTDYYMHLQGTPEGTLTDIRTLKATDEAEFNKLYNELMQDPERGISVTIKGIARLKDTSASGSLNTGICFTSALTQQMLESYNNSDAVKSGTVGAVSLVPTSISFYASSFEAKETIEEFINTYNSGVEESKQIEYTDYIGLIMSSVSTIISAISYVLIAFVSVSLIVSSIMIGIITYISVLERIKEIGILRAVGASKKDIKRVFTAETLIIGLISGLIGVGVALLLTIPINLIIKSLAGIAGVAKLPVLGAVILIAISCGLTLIAGLIPAKIASKKDPVIALRSE